MANPLDKFELGIRKLIEEMMIERMGENDKIVTRYMADQEFQDLRFPSSRVRSLKRCGHMRRQSNRPETNSTAGASGVS